MVCDKYKKGLTEAAASGAALSHALHEQVQACEHCAAMLAGERNLFAAVDAGLQKAANAKVRPSFVPNVKANLATETVPTGPRIPGWAFVCATGALALAVSFLGLIRGAHDKSRTEAITVPSKVPAGAVEGGSIFVPERKSHSSAKAFKAREEQKSFVTTTHEPEVLIQPEEEESLKRFYATVSSAAGEAKVVIADAHEVTPKPLVIEQIEVTDLRIENLDEGLTKTGTK